MRLVLFVVFLAALAAVVLAQTQILPNPDMDGCNPGDSGLYPLSQWTALLGGSDVTADRSSSVANANFLLQPGTGPASDTCTLWFAGPNTLVLTPTSFVNAAGITTPSLFTFSGWFACDTFGPTAPCVFSLQINGGSLIIPLGSIIPGAPAPFVPLTAQFPFNPSTDTISIVGTSADSFIFGYVTQALFTTDEIIEDDPHIDLGFMKFDFDGQPNRVYNLISSPSLQVLLLFEFSLDLSLSLSLLASLSRISFSFSFSPFLFCNSFNS